MKAFFNNHKKLIIIIGIILVILIVLVGLFSLIAPDYRKSLYGNRLESIKNHKISSQKIDNLKDDVKSLKYVSDIDYNLKGKIMNFVITVDQNTSLENAKKVGTKILEDLDKNEKENYDIQVFIVTDDKSDNYPVIGYKHKISDELVWTK